MGADAPVACRIPGRSDGLEVWGDPNDHGVMGAIRATGAYEPHVMIALSRLLRPDAVCIDGGANIGVLSLAMARFAPHGHVYAFEPGATAFAYLEKNLAANVAPNVTPLPLALWDRTTKLQLNVDTAHLGGAFLGHVDDRYSTPETVEAVTLDDWVADRGLERVDLIKLDVEGAEPQALAGARETIRRFQPVVVVEFNPVTLLRFAGHDCWQLWELVRELSKAVSYVRPDGRPVPLGSRYQAARLLARHGYLDLVGLPGRPGLSGRSLYEWGASWREVAKLTLRYNRLWPSRQAFLYEPSYQARFLINELRLPAGTTTTVPLRLVNTGSVWLNSDYPQHPIAASYHWLTAAGEVVKRDGPRTLFDRPLGPGRRTVLPLHVEAPLAAGHYRLTASVVQESFAWCDDLRPGLVATIPVTII
jgi:FkbM family methyltransferase